MKKQVALILLFAFFVSLFSGCKVFSKPKSVHFEEVKSFTAEEKKLKSDTCITINKILVNPIDRKEIFVFTSAGFLRSEDSGGSWAVLNFPKQDIIEFAAISENGTLYAVGGLGKLYSYSKSGWKYISEINYKVSINCFCTGAENVLYVKSDYWLYRSDDGGKSFHRVKLPGFLDWTGDYKVYVNPFKRSEVYVYSENTLYASEDSGNTWKGLNIPHGKNFSEYPEILSLCNGSANSLFILAGNGTEKKKFAVFSFSGKNRKVIAHNLPFVGKIYANPFDNNELFVYLNGLFVIKNGALLTPHSLLEYPVSVAAIGKGRIIAANYLGKLFVLKKGKGTVDFVGKDNIGVSSVSVCNGKIYAVKNNGIYILKNLASSGTAIESIPENMRNEKSLLPFLITFPEEKCLSVFAEYDNDNCFIISNENGKTKKTDLGNKFITDMVKGPLPFSVLISASDGVYLYSAKSGKLKKIGFDGKEVRLLYVDKNTIYAAMQNFSGTHTLFKSVDYGKTWEPVDSGILKVESDRKDILWGVIPAAIYADGNDIYIANHSEFLGQRNSSVKKGKLKIGLYVSKDGGKSWEYVWSLVKNKDFSVVYIYGVWKYKGNVFVWEETQCEGDKILYSSDLENWKTLKGVPDPAYPFVSCLCPDASSGVLYVGISGGMYSVPLPGAH